MSRPFSTSLAIAGMADIMDQDDLRELPLDMIDPDPDQPRKTWDTQEAQAEYEATRESIRNQGVRQPVTVRNGEGGRFILISGETRYRASRELGRRTIPALVRQRIDKRQVRIDQLLENVRRNALNPLDLAHAMQERLDDGMSRDELMHALGCTEQWLSKRLSVLKLPVEVQELARDGTIRDIDTLSALGQLDGADRAEHIRALQTGAIDGAAVRNSARKKRKKKKRPTAVDPNVKALISKMQDHFGARVRLEHNQKTGKGSVTFTFFSLDELQGLLQKWNFPQQ